MLDLEEQIYLIRALLKQLLKEKYLEDQQDQPKCKMCKEEKCKCPDDVEFYDEKEEERQEQLVDRMTGNKPSLF